MSRFDLETFWKFEASEHLTVAKSTFRSCTVEFAQMLEICRRSVEDGGKIMFFGNGGSAADAQHLATELSVRYKENRVPIPAIALTTDTSAITAGGNDLGFDHIFSRQVDALGKAGDVVIGISTSGKSENVLEALKMAKEKRIATIGLTGKDGGHMHDFCDCLIVVPSNTTARIQEMHITLGQMLCGALEQKLKLV
ncbi:MAG: D-sedoheptulose 7-phosphate isomerase [Pseudomonadota bacterium]